MWRSVAASGSPSASRTARTVTVCSVAQVLAVNVSGEGVAVTSPLSLSSVMLAGPSGGVVRTAVYMALPPSANDKLVRLRLTPACRTSAVNVRVAASPSTSVAVSV